jgi:hypothetical protein
MPSLEWTVQQQMNMEPTPFVILTDVDSEDPTIAVKCGGNLPNLAEYINMDSHCPEAAALFSALCFL